MRLSKMRLMLALMFAADVAAAVVLVFALTAPPAVVHTPSIRRTIIQPAQPASGAPCRPLGGVGGGRYPPGSYVPPGGDEVHECR